LNKIRLFVYNKVCKIPDALKHSCSGVALNTHFCSIFSVFANYRRSTAAPRIRRTAAAFGVAQLFLPAESSAPKCAAEHTAAGHARWRHPAALRMTAKRDGYAALRRDAEPRRLAPALRRMLAARRTRLTGFLFCLVAPLRGARRVLLAVLAMVIASLSIVFCPYESQLT
jgi:hypothetical protein